MKMKKILLPFLMSAVMLAMTACGGNTTTNSTTAATTATTTAATTAVETTAASTAAGTVEASKAAAALPTADPAGNAIQVPADVHRLVSFAPSITQEVIALGLQDKLVAVDSQSPNYAEGLAELPQFDIMKPDVEALMALKPDFVLVSGMSAADSDSPFKPLVDAGICVATIPSSESIDGVESDIRFVADCFGKHAEGEAIVAEMTASIDEIAAIGKTITDRKKVLFEIAALPTIYSFGKGTFLNEMLEIIGADNVLADQQSWVAVTEEAAVAANPDVILTNVSYIPDAPGEILARKGWENVTAVKDRQVFQIDNGTSSLPNQNIVLALKQMAKAVYPDAYAAVK